MAGEGRAAGVGVVRDRGLMVWCVRPQAAGRKGSTERAPARTGAWQRNETRGQGPHPPIGIARRTIESAQPQLAPAWDSPRAAMAQQQGFVPQQEAVGQIVELLTNVHKPGADQGEVRRFPPRPGRPSPPGALPAGHLAPQAAQAAVQQRARAPGDHCPRRRRRRRLPAAFKAGLPAAPRLAARRRCMPSWTASAPPPTSTPTWPSSSPRARACPSR